MAEVSRIQYKGKTIFLADHRGTQGNDVAEDQERLLQMIKDSGSSDALSLTDMTGVYATPELHDKMKEIGDEIVKHCKKAAVVGMSSGARKILISTFMMAVSRPMKLFDTVEEAEEWLVSD